MGYSMVLALSALNFGQALCHPVGEARGIVDLSAEDDERFAVHEQLRERAPFFEVRHGLSLRAGGDDEREQADATEQNFSFHE